MAVVSIVLALLLDTLVGEPRYFHPLIGFGWLAHQLEKASGHKNRTSFFALTLGGICWALLTLLAPLGIGLLSSSFTAVENCIFSILVLYLCVGNRALLQHAVDVSEPLTQGNMQVARVTLAKIVSRDCETLDENGIASATVESVLENGSDAVVAPIIWFLFLGAPGALFYRLANTLDAMWGYKTVSYAQFGFVAARMDDLLNWIPARCCAALYALAGNTRFALQCWREQGHLLESPNAGPVMASGSGALRVINGGMASYQGKSKHRPQLGTGSAATPKDIRRSLGLLQLSLLYLILAIACGEVLLCKLAMAAS